MKGIFKKTLVCAIAACAFTSSVTAFAATNAKVTQDIEVVREDWTTKTNYRIKGLSIAEATRYNSNFDFYTTVEMPKDETVSRIGVVYELMNANTGKQYGMTQIVYEYDKNSVVAFDSVPLSILSPVAAKCYHHAYQGNVTLMNHLDGMTFVVAE